MKERGKKEFVTLKIAYSRSVSKIENIYYTERFMQTSCRFLVHLACSVAVCAIFRDFESLYNAVCLEKFLLPLFIYIYIYIKYNLRSFNKRVTKIVEEEKEKVAAIELERKIVRCESVEMLTPGSEGC